MQFSKIVRILSYSAIALALAAAALLGLTVYLRGLQIPGSVLHSNAAKWLASRYGVEFTLQSLQFGCLKRDCSREVNAGALTIALQTPEPLRIELKETHWKRGNPITGKGLEVRSGDRPPLVAAGNFQIDSLTHKAAFSDIRVGLLPEGLPAEIDNVEFDGVSKHFIARGIRLSSAGVNSIQLRGWDSAADDTIVLDKLEIAGVRGSAAKRAPSDKTICEQLPSAGDNGSEALASLRPLLPLLLSDVRLMKADLLRVAFIAGIVLLVLKIITTLWIRNLPVLLLLSAIPAALPFLLYFQFRQPLLIGIAVIAAIAVALRIFVYRRGKRWYHRWEPFMVDLTAIAVLLPLFGLGLELPPFPEAPKAVRINSIDIADIEVQSPSPAQIQIPLAMIRNVFVALPGVDPRIEVETAAVEIPKVRIAAAPSRVALDGTRIDGVNVVYNPRTGEVGNIAAHVRLAGLFESDALAKELRNIEYLRGIDLRSRLDFDADVHAAGPASASAPSTQFSNSKRLIAANAAITLRPVECTLSFDVATRIQTPQLRLAALADGNTENIRVRSLSSLPDSPIRIAAGSGTVSLARAPEASFKLESIGGFFASTRLDIDSIGINASAPASGKTGIQTATISAGPARVRPASGWDIRVARSSVHLDRMPDRSSVPVRSEMRMEGIQLQGPGGRIEVTVPSVVTWLSGQGTPETIPHHFNGTVDFAATRASDNGELFGANRPIAFEADLWKGLLNVPEQDVVFRSAMLSDSSAELPIQLKLAGRLSSIVPRPNGDIEAQAALSHLEQDMGSAHLELADARISGRMNWDEQGSSAGLNYGIASTRVALSPGPSAICLNEISTLDLSTSGSISRLPEWTGLSSTSSSNSSPSPCAVLPPMPESLEFRIAGNFPAGAGESLLRLERQDGTGIRIEGVRSEIDRLLIRDGRLVNIETRADVSGIGNLQDSAAIDVLANIRQSKDSVQLETGIRTPDGVRLLDAAIVSTPGRFTLNATQHVPADRLITQIQPFLSDLHFDPGNLNPQARVTQLHADADFENGELVNAAVLARLDSGALLTMNSPDLQANLASSPSSANPVFGLNIGRASPADGPRPIVATANVSGLHVGAVTNTETVIAADADVRVIAQGTLYMSGQPPVSPVLDKVTQVRTALTTQASSLAPLLGTPAETDTGAQPLSNLRWKVHLSQNSPQSPLLRLSPAALEFHIADAAIEAAWDGNTAPDRSQFALSTALDSSVSLQGNDLILDLLSPSSLKVALNGQPESQYEFNVPIQAAFSGRLVKSAANSGTLWNQDYYAQFWRTHPSKFAGPPFVSPIDFNEVMLGNLSVREIRFPLEPVRAVIGYTDALQIGIPFSGRALFGGVTGSLESSVAAEGGIATLDTRLNLDLRNLQAGAIGSTMSGEHATIIEDELDGEISIRVDGLKLNRTTIPAMRAGHFSAEDLETLGASVHFSRSMESAGIPGVFQASSSVQINLVNEVLNKIVEDLRLPAPPRALTYSDLAVNFNVDRGRVRTDSEVFKLGGVQLFSSNLADASAEVRAHLGRPGERIMLGSLIEMLGNVTSAMDAGGR